MTNEIAPNTPNLENLSTEAQRIHSAIQNAAQEIGAPISNVVINKEALYEADNNQNFSLTGPGIHYQQENGIVQVIVAQPGIPTNQQTLELQKQTQLNQTKRAFFNNESQGNTSKREQNLRLTNQSDT